MNRVSNNPHPIPASVTVSLDLLRWLSVQDETTIRAALCDMAASSPGFVWGEE